MKDSRKLECTSFVLHIMAMMLMFCDHLWGTIVPGNDWLTCIGRISFPIFAFMIVEGYFRTKDLRKYVFRLLVFALISEIPFDLAMGGRVFYPVHQNVLWTFLIALGMIQWNERARKSGIFWKRAVTGLASVLLGSLAGLITMVDFYHAGVLTVLAFYFFRHRTWWARLGQLMSLAYINLEILGGLVYEFSLFGKTLFFHQQGFALLALIPIWLYRGKQGHHSKVFQYGCYLFYPCHLLVLGILAIL